MIAKSRRIRLTRDFERVFAVRQSVHAAFFRIKIAPNKLGYTRCAVVVSAKVSKRAVVRNRVRRRAWSVIAQYIDTLPKGLDIVFMATPDAARADFEAIKKELKLNLSKRVL